jgi:hypothetical protein
MTLVANSSGVVNGKFTIPAGVLAGSKLVEFTGSGGSFGSANFVGQGTLRTDTKGTVTTTTVHNRYYDPLAQTFTLATREQIGGVELFVTQIGTTPFVVQIRETEVGMPTRTVIAETRKQPANLLAGQWNRFEFATPVTLLPDVEYAVVVMCNDAVGEVAISELGKWDATSQSWVTSQPYNVGVLLSSSNASTWTPHQDRDLTFRLLGARYTQAQREIDLGHVAVSNATDLLIVSTVDQPDVQANAQLELTMPDSSKVAVAGGQVVRLSNPVTGNVGVKAKLSAINGASASLMPGTQIIAGSLQASADYVTRAFDADAAGADIRIIFNAILPSGSGVQVFVSGVDAGDAWLPVTQNGSALPLGDGVYEYQYLYTDLEEARVRVKLVLSGTAAARPYVANLRVSVT